MFRLLTLGLALTTSASAFAAADNDPKRQYSTALADAIHAVESGEPNAASIANQQLHTAARCVFMLSRSPLQTMASINLRLANNDSDLERLHSLSQLSQGGPAENKNPCIPYSEEG
ncbi:hypothetical protein R50073_42280 [Maricurvus nonylphenolicus]|uniref:hypothetical protein n=1 Tax=Maricurvus nonylphenolicus TaxID=1008307 RepID=UPI0036F33678